MELLVYCRCYRPWGASTDEPARRELGAVVGERVPALGQGEWLCSFVELRLPVTVVDPCTEIELLVAKAFAAWGHPGGGRVLRFRNGRGTVALLLEPGFERARDLCRALQPVLPHARMLLERAQRDLGTRGGAEDRAHGQPARSRAMPRHVERRSAAPEAVDPASDRVAPLRLVLTPPRPFSVPPRVGR